ncbi:sensor histidine kinase [Actinomycetospora lemnae]|uniref:sensor histidine kinase n=1 Tax=Actinomycetospora lemnae TaxID=3019891 RepID=UPI0038CBFB49
MRTLLVEGLEPRAVGHYDAAPLIRETLLVYSFGAEIRTEVARSLPVRGDPSTLRHTLVNLLVNCAAHAPGSDLTVTGSREDGAVTVRVADSGPRTRASGPRSGRRGIGLALSRRLLAEEGGSVELVANAAGRGHVAEVRLVAAGRPGEVGPPESGRDRDR